MPGSPVTNWVVVAFLAFVTVLLAFNASQRVALYAGAVWAVLILAAYAIHVRRRHGRVGRLHVTTAWVRRWQTGSMRALAIVHQPDAGPASSPMRCAARRRARPLADRRGPGRPPTPRATTRCSSSAGRCTPTRRSDHLARGGEVAAARAARARASRCSACASAPSSGRGGRARAAPRAAPEIGWHEVELTPEGAATRCSARSPPRFEAFQWHSYEFAAPAGRDAARPQRGLPAGLPARRAPPGRSSSTPR